VKEAIVEGHKGTIKGREESVKYFAVRSVKPACRRWFGGLLAAARLAGTSRNSFHSKQA
jgi:hypothetical protein